MARVLAMAQSTHAADAAEFYDTVRQRRDYFEAAGCRYWVFEDVAGKGTFVEFAEAADEGTLAAALRGPAGDIFTGAIFKEVGTR